MTYEYDKNRNYSQDINAAVSKGDYRTAAILEAQRNAKIQGEGLTQYQTTSHYTDYLPRTEQINAGLDKLGDGSSWEYDPGKDPAMQAYRKQYLREADRGTRDTMAAAASMTGGVPSTAAVQAGQQAGNYYRAQLADKVPELMQADYNRYMQGREADRADLSLLFNIDQQRQQDSWSIQQQEYERQNTLWQQAMSRWNMLGYADQSVADALGVPVGTSTQDAAYQQKQLEYQQWQQQQSERSDAYDRALTQINMGLMPDAATLAAAGLSEAAARAMQAKVLQQIAQANSSGGGTRTVYRYVTDPDKDEEEEGDVEPDSRYLNNEEYQDLLTMIRQAGSYDAAYKILNRFRNRVSNKQGEEIGHILARLYPSDPDLIPGLN